MILERPDSNRDAAGKLRKSRKTGMGANELRSLLLLLPLLAGCTTERIGPIAHGYSSHVEFPYHPLPPFKTEEPVIGSSWIEVRAILGEPWTVNTTRTSSGTFTQVVYRNCETCPASFYYFEGDILTAIQLTQ